MIKYYLILLMLLTCISAFAQTGEITQVAVMNLDAGGMEQSAIIALSDRLRTELLNTGRFDVMERNRMDLILQEQGLQQSGACNDTECVVQMGQILGVERMIAGSVGKVGKIYTLAVQMIDIETGRIIMSKTEDCDCPIENVLTQSVRNIALKMAGLLEEPIPADDAEPAVKEKKGRFPWLWVGLGAVAVGGGAAWLLSGDNEQEQTTGKVSFKVSKNQ